MRLLPSNDSARQKPKNAAKPAVSVQLLFHVLQNLPKRQRDLLVSAPVVDGASVRPHVLQASLPSRLRRRLLRPLPQLPRPPPRSHLHHKQPSPRLPRSPRMFPSICAASLPEAALPPTPKPSTSLPHLPLDGGRPVLETLLAVTRMPLPGLVTPRQAVASCPVRVRNRLLRVQRRSARRADAPSPAEVMLRLPGQRALRMARLRRPRVVPTSLVRSGRRESRCFMWTL